MLLVFDWDGTLADSTATIVDCMQRAAQDTGLPVRAADAICHIIGLGLPEAIAALYPATTSVCREAIRSAYVQHFVAEDRGPTLLFPGVRDTLHALFAAGHTLAVATGKSRRGLQRALHGLNDIAGLFSATRCADETQSKPHPQMLWELLDELAVDANHAVMVGDTHYDMEMAARAGIARIGVSYGAHAVAALQAFDPLACVDRFVDIVPIIEQWQE